MVEIIPAIIPQSIADIREKGNRVRGLVPVIQIDICDGIFVPRASWPYVTGGPQELRRLIDTGQNLPLWDEFSYEVDLMVAHPEDVVGAWIDLGVRRVIVHVESTKEVKKILALLEKRIAECPDYGGISPIEFGLALGVETPISTLAPYNNRIDFVQVMGIARIGYQGERFDERAIAKISQLRREYPHLIISVDGGVNFQSAPRLIEAGASRLVSGSAIFGSGNPAEAIKKLSGGV